MNDLRDRLKKARQQAQSTGVPTRRKDLQLYALLQDCFDICQTVSREGAREQLVDAVVSQDKGKRNRVYVMTTSSVQVLVCRYVLEGKDNRNSIYRYAAALEQAAARQIPPDTLADWLFENGGVNRLFKSRPTEKRSCQTSTLHLNSKVDVPKNGTFTLTLRRDERGYFDVLSQEVK